LMSIMALTYFKGMHYNECLKIINRYSNYDEFKYNAFNLRQGDFFEKQDKKELTNIQIAEKQLELAHKFNYQIISIWDDSYPALLKEIDFSPIILYVHGKLQHTNAFSISVVGTRKNTNYGTLATEHFVKEFVKNNIIITSGMATGIDRISHKTAMNNEGITYAVIASGLDKILPNIAKQFAQEIVNSGGAIISEYKIGTSAMQGYFLQRNRIISGISKATLIVESAYKGGALNTANFAGLYNRDVFAIPGSIFSEKSEGTNNLIYKNKSIIANSPQQILKELQITPMEFEENIKNDKSYYNQTLSENAQIIFNLISMEPIHIDSIFEQSNLDISECLIQLLELEFSDMIKQLPGKYYIRGC